jgi:hypothetical protein
MIDAPPDYDVGPDQRAKCYLHAPAASADVAAVQPGAGSIRPLGEGA